MKKVIAIFALVLSSTFAFAQDTPLEISGSADAYWKYDFAKTANIPTSFATDQNSLSLGMIDIALKKNINLGFDSCGCHRFLNAIIGHPKEKEFKTLAVPCESTLESSYIDVNGDFYPCSFTEGSEGWEKGISVVEAEDFVRDVWYHERTQAFRERLWSCNRHCPIYEV